MGLPLSKALLQAQAYIEIAIARAYYLRWPRRIEADVPDFLVIGAQKSATTWLDSVLRQDERVFLPAGRKEVHYFDASLWKGRQWYSWHFRNEKERLKGEITPGYSILSPARIMCVRELNPQVQVIIILRNPVERAWSMAIMDVFKWKAAEINSSTLRTIHDHAMSAKSYRRGEYSKILMNWWSVFDRRQVKVLFYDQIKENPKKFYSKVKKSIGLEDNCEENIPTSIDRRVHTGVDNMPEETRLFLSKLYLGELILLNKMLSTPETNRWLLTAKETIRNNS